MGCGCSRHDETDVVDTRPTAAMPQAAAQPRDVGAISADSGAADPDLAKLELKSRQESSILKANGLMQQGEYDAAITVLTSTIKTFPECARAYLDRGQCYQSLKQPEDAIRDFTQALELQQELYVAYTSRARVYVQLQRYPEAIADCKAAIRINNENQDAYQIRAEAEASQERYEGCDHVGNIFNSPKAQETKTCAVCMDMDRGCRIHPCMHAALCVGCATELQGRGFRCPICDGPIKEVEPGEFMDTFAFGDQKTVDEMLQAAAEVRASMSPLSSPQVYSPLMWSSSRAPQSNGSSLRELPAVAHAAERLAVQSEESGMQQLIGEEGPPSERLSAAAAELASLPSQGVGENIILDGNFSIDIDEAAQQGALGSPSPNRISAGNSQLPAESRLHLTIEV